MRQWDEEDAARMSRITAAHPQPFQGECCCTPEHRLFHTALNFGFHQVSAESSLRAEVFKSDLWREQQLAVTADRDFEVNRLLHEINEHTADQICDLETTLGTEGKGEALVAYLKRYQQRDDLQVRGRKTHPSAALTSKLLAKTDAMLQRWTHENATRKQRFDEMLRKE